MLKIYNPLQHNGDKLEVVSDSYLYLYKDPKQPVKKMNSLLSFNGEFDSTNLAIWTDDGEVMVIFKIVHNKLKELIFPHKK